MIFRPLTRDFVKEHARYLVGLLGDWKYAAWKEDNFLYELPCKWEFSFGAFDNDLLLGFCFASNKIAGVYYIHLLFIAPGARGQSMGPKMLEEARNIAAAHDIHTIELRCPESNKRAVDFYIDNGFVIADRLKDEVSGDEADYYLRSTF